MVPECRTGTNGLKDRQDLLDNQLGLRVGCLLRSENLRSRVFQALAWPGNLSDHFPRCVQQLTSIGIICE